MQLYHLSLKWKSHERIVEESVGHSTVPSASGGKPCVTQKNRGPDRGPYQDGYSGDGGCHEHYDHGDHDDHDDHHDHNDMMIIMITMTMVIILIIMIIMIVMIIMITMIIMVTI